MKKNKLEQQRRRRARLLYKVAQLKLQPCSDCGGQFIPPAMEFDHREPSDKVEEVGALAARGRGWSRIVAEVEKCDLVCANCHRYRTWVRAGQRPWWVAPVAYKLVAVPFEEA